MMTDSESSTASGSPTSERFSSGESDLSAQESEQELQSTPVKSLIPASTTSAAHRPSRSKKLPLKLRKSEHTELIQEVDPSSK